MSQRVKKLPSKGKGEDGTQTMSKLLLCVEFSDIKCQNVASLSGSKGKRKRQRVGGGTKGSNGGGVQSGDDALQSQPDSASKTPWTPRYLSDLKSSNIYNRIATEAPAEVFSKLTTNTHRITL